MSEEWAYRYQEEQMEQYLGAVRDFRRRAKRSTATFPPGLQAAWG